VSRLLTHLAPRSAQLVLRLGSQAVPAAGVFGLSWPAAGGLMLYWFESVLALGATLLLLALFARRARAPERGKDREEIATRGLKTRDVLIFQGGAFGMFGLFFGGLMVIFVGNGYVESSGLREALAGVPLLAGIIALALAIDLVRLRRLTAADLAARVEAGNRRFMLFWLVGFFGTLAAAFLNKPLLVFGVFAGVKALFEIGAVLQRVSPQKI